jgi:hypothetical protein
MGEESNAHRVLFGKAEKKQQFGGLMHGGQDAIKTYLKRMGSRVLN